MHNFGFYIAVMLLSTQISADHKNTPKVYFICNLVSIVTWNLWNVLLAAAVTFISSPSSASSWPVLVCVCLCSWKGQQKSMQS